MESTKQEEALSSQNDKTFLFGISELKKAGLKGLLFCSFMTSIAFSPASKAYVDKECQRNLENASSHFLEKNAKLLTGQNKQVLTYRFLSFKNTTPGSYDQVYEVDMVVRWPSGHRGYPFEQSLRLEFFSPFICDRLQLRGF